jgi:hypothetical protein
MNWLNALDSADALVATTPRASSPTKQIVRIVERRGLERRAFLGNATIEATVATPESATARKAVRQPEAKREYHAQGRTASKNQPKRRSVRKVTVTYAATGAM